MLIVYVECYLYVFFRWEVYVCVCSCVYLCTIKEINMWKLEIMISFVGDGRDGTERARGRGCRVVAVGCWVVRLHACLGQDGRPREAEGGSQELPR